VKSFNSPVAVIFGGCPKCCQRAVVDYCDDHRDKTAPLGTTIVCPSCGTGAIRYDKVKNVTGWRWEQLKKFEVTVDHMICLNRTMVIKALTAEDAKTLAEEDVNWDEVARAGICESKAWEPQVVDDE